MQCNFMLTLQNSYNSFIFHLYSYQNGPDTYLLQLRDTDFPVRLREYMKVACNRSPGFSRSITEDNGFDWRVNV